MAEEANIPLTDKQELFCYEYLNDLNATQAYIRSFSCDNYGTARTESSRLMANPNISAHIKQLQKERADNLMLDATFVLENLIKVNQRSLQAEEVKVWNHETKQMEGTGEYVFDSNGANKSLELLGKHLGMFKDKVEHSGEIKGREVIIEGRKFAKPDED